MNFKLGQPWIPLERINALIQFEPALITIGLAVGAWAFYRIFLKKLSAERHVIVKNQFRGLAGFMISCSISFGLYHLMLWQSEFYFGLDRLAALFGMITLILGGFAFVRTLRIMLLEYLFASHMRAEIPILLVNIFSLSLSIAVMAWAASEGFGIRLVPLLATSAAVSLVLGLALQETLGNLFAGIALQLDKPYEMGDWVEIAVDSNKWVGKVHEITWRATTIRAFTEELITFPNRVIATNQISNYSTRDRPMIRAESFHFSHTVDVDHVRKILLETVHGISGIRSSPAPLALISDSTDSWLTIRLVYFINEFGEQYLIKDKVIEQCLKALHKSGIPLASKRLQVTTSP